MKMSWLIVAVLLVLGTANMDDINPINDEQLMNDAYGMYSCMILFHFLIKLEYTVYYKSKKLVMWDP